MTALGPLAAGVLVNVAVLPLLYGGVIYAVCQSAMGNPVTLWGALRGAFRRYFQVLFYYLLIGLMFVRVLPVSAVDLDRGQLDRGAASDVHREHRAVRGHGPELAARRKVGGGGPSSSSCSCSSSTTSCRLALGAFLYLGQVLLTILVSPYLALALYEGAVVLVSALVTPVLLIAIVLIYFDLRVRKEALDLFQLAHQVAVSPPAPA